MENRITKEITLPSGQIIHVRGRFENSADYVYTITPITNPALSTFHIYHEDGACRMDWSSGKILAPDVMASLEITTWLFTNLDLFQNDPKAIGEYDTCPEKIDLPPNNTYGGVEAEMVDEVPDEDSEGLYLSRQKDIQEAIDNLEVEETMKLNGITVERTRINSYTLDSGILGVELSQWDATEILFENQA